MTYALTEQNPGPTRDAIEVGWVRRFAQRCLWPVRFVRRLHAEHRQVLALQFAGSSERRDFDALGMRPPYS